MRDWRYGYTDNGLNCLSLCLIQVYLVGEGKIGDGPRVGEEKCWSIL